MVQKIELTKGCSRQCEFCYGHNNGKIETFPMPAIQDPVIEWIDVNILENPELDIHLGMFKALKASGVIKSINLVQGVDFRRVTESQLRSLYQLRIIPLRFAWDWGYGYVSKLSKFIALLERVGWKRNQMQIFIIYNWKMSIYECMIKLETLKYWNIQVSHCCYPDGSKKPAFWAGTEIKLFSSACRKHNQMCRHRGYDPEYGKRPLRLRVLEEGISNIWDPEPEVNQ